MARLFGKTSTWHLEDERLNFLDKAHLFKKGKVALVDEKNRRIVCKLDPNTAFYGSNIFSRGFFAKVDCVEPLPDGVQDDPSLPTVFELQHKNGKYCFILISNNLLKYVYVYKSYRRAALTCDTYYDILYEMDMAD